MNNFTEIKVGKRKTWELKNSYNVRLEAQKLLYVDSIAVNGLELKESSYKITHSFVGEYFEVGSSFNCLNFLSPVNATNNAEVASYAVLSIKGKLKKGDVIRIAYKEKEKVCLLERSKKLWLDKNENLERHLYGLLPLDRSIEIKEIINKSNEEYCRTMDILLTGEF